MYPLLTTGPPKELFPSLPYNNLNLLMVLQHGWNPISKASFMAGFGGKANASIAENWCVYVTGGEEANRYQKTGGLVYGGAK